MIAANAPPLAPSSARGCDGPVPSPCDCGSRPTGLGCACEPASATTGEMRVAPAPVDAAACSKSAPTQPAMRRERYFSCLCRFRVSDARQTTSHSTLREGLPSHPRARLQCALRSARGGSLSDREGRSRRLSPTSPFPSLAGKPSSASSLGFPGRPSSHACLHCS